MNSITYSPESFPPPQPHYHRQPSETQMGCDFPTRLNNVHCLQKENRTHSKYLASRVSFLSALLSVQSPTIAEHTAQVQSDHLFRVSCSGYLPPPITVHTGLSAGETPNTSVIIFVC